MSAFLAVGAVANVALLFLVGGIVVAKRRTARAVAARAEVSVANGMSATEVAAVKRPPARS